MGRGEPRSRANLPSLRRASHVLDRHRLIAPRTPLAAGPLADERADDIEHRIEKPPTLRTSSRLSTCVVPFGLKVDEDELHAGYALRSRFHSSDISVPDEPDRLREIRKSAQD